MQKETIINELFKFSDHIRYAAIYCNDDLIYRQKDEALDGASSGETDKYEELLVNPTLLKLASQRGDIDCGGLDHLLIGYGNFYQLVKAVPGGHISICLDKDSDINNLPGEIFSFLNTNFPELMGI